MRDLEERFESRVLPLTLLCKRTRQVRELIPELYLHGLALGDFDLALRGLFRGQGYPCGPPRFAVEREVAGRMGGLAESTLENLEVVYLWVDGIYVKAGLEKEKAVLLVVLAALSDGSKAVVSVTSGYRESTQSWSVLRDLNTGGGLSTAGDSETANWASGELCATSIPRPRSSAAGIIGYSTC